MLAASFRHVAPTPHAVGQGSTSRPSVGSPLNPPSGALSKNCVTRSGGPTATRDMSATKAASLTTRGLDEQRLAIVAARMGSEHRALVSILLALHSSPDRWAEEERVRRGYLVDGSAGRSH